MTTNIKKIFNKIDPKEFKQEAMKLALESPSITGTALEHEIHIEQSLSLYLMHAAIYNNSNVI